MIIRKSFGKILLSVLCLSALSVTAEDGGPVRTSEPPLPPPGKFPPRMGRGERGRNPHDAFFARLTKEERATVDQLAKAGKKEELRKTMHALFFKYRPPEMKKLDELSDRYLASGEEREKTAIRNEMEKILREMFRKRMDFTRESIAAAERHLERARQDLARLKNHYRRGTENMDKIIADRVEQMCLPKEQRRKPPKMKGPKGPRSF